MKTASRWARRPGVRPPCLGPLPALRLPGHNAGAFLTGSFTSLAHAQAGGLRGPDADRRGLCDGGRTRGPARAMDEGRVMARRVPLRHAPRPLDAGGPCARLPAADRLCRTCMGLPRRAPSPGDGGRALVLPPVSPRSVPIPLDMLLPTHGKCMGRDGRSPGAAPAHLLSVLALAHGRPGQPHLTARSLRQRGPGPAPSTASPLPGVVTGHRLRPRRPAAVRELAV